MAQSSGYRVSRRTHSNWYVALGKKLMFCDGEVGKHKKHVNLRDVHFPCLPSVFSWHAFSVVVFKVQFSAVTMLYGYCV